jgi:hypothetical protein
MAELFNHCRGLAAPIGRVACAAMVLVTGHLVLLALLFVWRLVYVVVGALWEGVRPHVVSFGSASAFAFFGWLRRRLGLPPET